MVEIDSLDRPDESFEQAQDSQSQPDHNLSPILPGSSALWVPTRLVESAWLGHIPFAFWLTAAVRPNVFVELGTHTGASYCGFCQAIASLSLGTAAYAVDTWEGDKHAGFYRDSVFDELNQYNLLTYPGFSRLLRYHFDDALKYFNDQEIDLLHIDGLHTYDAVRHDFESWLPKMSRRGVVLLHDINVRERDFGVWRLWGEISARYPSFTFHHHHGLGVACVGNELPPGLDRLIAAAGDPQAAALWRGSFAHLGQGIQARWEASFHAKRAAGLAEQQESLHRKLADGEAANRQLAASLEDLHRKLADGETVNRQLAASLEEMSATATTLVRQRDKLVAERAASLREQVAERTASLREQEASTARLAEALAKCGVLDELRQTVSIERDHIQRELDRHKRACDTLARELRKHRRRRQKMKNSFFRRATRPLRALVGGVGAPFKQRKEERRRSRTDASISTLGAAETVSRHADLEAEISKLSTSCRSYAEWVAAYDTFSDSDRESIVAHIASLVHRPLISVVMPVYNPDPAHLRAAIESVRSQLYPNWQLCIADDASTRDGVCWVLEHYAGDNRIRIVHRSENGHISAASNDALALAEGEFIALMDHDDLIPEHALYEVALVINRQIDVDLIYSDEDQIDESGKLINPYFKPDWDPDLFLVHNLISHLGVYRRSKVEAVGGFRHGYEGSQDYDLALRFVKQTTENKIRHIPTVLYHWRKNRDHSSFSSDLPDRCAAAARRAINEHISDRHQLAEVSPLPGAPHWQRVQYALPEPRPLVTVIVPTRDRFELLSPCIEGIRHKTDYDKVEILVVDNDSSDPRTLQYLSNVRSDPRIRIVSFPGSFNFSAMNNFAVKEAQGEILLFLNNDVEVIHRDWLHEMVAQASRHEIGAVGAKLIYPNGKIQHAGVVLGVGGVAAHYGEGANRTDSGYFHLFAACRSVSGVTAACLAIRRITFVEIGGFNAIDLQVAFNDVDLCLRLREQGYRNLYTPFAELYHHESASRGHDLAPDKIDRFRREVSYMERRWGPILRSDPYYNPNFTLNSSHFELAWPPRRTKPWLQSTANQPCAGDPLVSQEHT